MLGHAAIAETALADVGGVLQVATAEMSGISSASSVGVGELVGVATLDANFTKTTAGILITGGANADLSFDFAQTTEDIKIVNFVDAVFSTEFTQTTDGIAIRITSASADLNFTKTASGDIMFVDVVTDATTETYTEITPSGAETWTEITPSGTETWTEIQ